MQTKRSMFKEYSGHLRCIYVCRKDRRILLNKRIVHDEEEQLRYSRIMLRLYTLLIIGLLTLLGMKIIDAYFDGINAQIESAAKMEQEAIMNQYRDLLEESVQFDYSTSYNLSSGNDMQIVSAHQIETTDPSAIYVDETPTEEIQVVEEESSIHESVETIPMDEMEFIYRVVEAEVTGTTYKWNGNYVDENEMLLSKIRVVQVFLNRVNDTSRFSDINSLYDAVSYPGASSTVASGRYLEVTVTDMTKQAVEIALNPDTPDYTDGALFFLANGATYNKYGEYLFTDAVGHSFFK